MKDTKKIIAFTKDVLSNASEIDNWIDESLEPIKDYTDTFGDLAGPIKGLLSILNLRRKYVLKSFLKNYSNCLNEEEFELSETEKEKLTKFFEKKSNILHISSIIEGLNQTKSIKTSAILGVLAGKFLKNKQDVTKEDLIIIESLKQFDDFDLENFIKLVDIYVFKKDFIKEPIEDKDITWRNTIKDNEEFRILTDDKKKMLFVISVEKFKGTGVLSFGVGGIGSVGNALGSFVISNMTQKLYTLVKDIDIN